MQNKERYAACYAFTTIRPVKKLFTIWLFLLLVLPGLAQNSKIPISRIGPLSLDSGTAWVQQVFDTAIGDDIQLVGLGEVSHGGYEPMALKAKMVQYLVEKRGYRNLLLEIADIGFIRPVRLYLSDNNVKDLSITDSLVAGMNVTPAAKTVLGNLFRWLKQYNLLHPAEMVRVEGFDLNGDAVFRNYFMYNYMIPYDHVTAHGLLSQWGRGDLSDSLKMASVYAWYLDHKSELEKKLSKPEFEYLDRQVELNLHSLLHFLWKSAGELSKASIYRDSIQAKNVALISGTQKAVVWAHNMHISTTPRCMGMYLRQRYGERYYILLTDYSDEANIYLANEKDPVLTTTQYFYSHSNTLAYMLSRYYRIYSGILFYRDVAARKISDRVNVIDAFGKSGVIGEGIIFHALVIFKKIHLNHSE